MCQLVQPAGAAMFIDRIPIYKRVFFLFIMLIFPIYILSITFIVHGGQYIRENRELNLQNQIAFIRNKLEFEFNAIVFQQENLLSNNTIQDLNYLSEVIDRFDEVKMVQSIEEQLFSIEHSSSLVANASLYLLDADLSLSSVHGFKRGISEERAVFEKYLKHGRKTISSFGNRLFFIRSYPVIAGNSETPIAYASIIELSLEALAERLSSITLGQEAEIRLHSSTADLTFPAPVPADESKAYKTKSYDLGFFDLELVTAIPQTGFTDALRTYYLLIALFVIISLFVFSLFTFFLNRMIHQPLNRFIQAFHKVEDEDFDVLQEAEGSGEFAYLYSSFRKIVQQLKNSMEDLYKSEIALKQAEYKNLQAQINPHFLYNSFFTVSKLCREEDIERAGDLTRKLGSYFRFITRNTQSEIPLKTEVQHIRDYIDIQNIRFGRRIHVSIQHLPESLGCIMVPRIILQPLVENAYEHAFNNTLEGGYIDIAFQEQDEILLISVSDNGDGISPLGPLNSMLENPESAPEKTALINISERLKLAFGQKSGVVLEPNGDSGLRVLLKLSL